MLRKMYDWTMALAAHRHAGWALFAVAFAESSIFPIPPDAVLIPMALADRAKAWRYALIATVASVLGGFAGYAIGYFLFDALGRPLLVFYGYLEAFHSFAARYNSYGEWIVFTAGVTPFPYKVITIASGATALNLKVFAIASVAARGLRFFLVCALLYWFGEPVRALIERYLGYFFAAFMIMLIGGFVVIKFLV